ncbi:MAG: hypothetical protein JNK15_01155, partial [Planctomycetes bacterium]|nr:hypothetical protein [Planctomycetota bacterium]
MPHLPFARLRSSCSDLGRALLERAPQWAHLAPERGESTGDRATTSYRIAPGSFWLQQRWRLVGDDWQERELDVVPGSIVALRFVLDDVAPAEVSRKLDLVPTRAFAKDEAGTRGRGVRAEGLWIHEVLP